jgi:hypothetical protein
MFGTKMGVICFKKNIKYNEKKWIQWRIRVKKQRN